MCLTITEMKFSYEVLREADWCLYTGQLSEKSNLIKHLHGRQNSKKEKMVN
jgi:hypothetical protein